MSEKGDENLSKKACIFRLLYWTKVTKVLSDIVLYYDFFSYKSMLCF